MASIKTVKQRIKSTKNTAQITKAMEVVSATKMRKSQGFAIQARPFAAASLELMRNLLARTPTQDLPPLLIPREIKKRMLLVVTSDKGLAGAFNANVLRQAEQWVEERKKSGQNFILVTIGKKARDYFSARGGERYPVQQSFVGFGDYSTLAQTLPVAERIIEGYLNTEWDEVQAVYMNFRTTLLQEPVLKKMLPVETEGIEDAVRAILPERGKYSATGKVQHATSYIYEYTFEPNPAVILSSLVPQLLRMHVHHIILESNASEHSARMVAMKNASDNAKELITDLTLEYNKARQAGITRELTEITAGKEALEN